MAQVLISSFLPFDFIPASMCVIGECMLGLMRPLFYLLTCYLLVGREVFVRKSNDLVLVFI